MKICKKCSIEKENSEYYKDKKSKDGYRGSCKSCMLIYQLSIDKEHRKLICKKSYYENIDSTRTYYRLNSNKIKKKRKERYKENKEKENEYSREYGKKNRKILSKHQLEYSKNRCKIDNIFKLSKNIRSLINNSFYKNGYKKDSKTSDILGCSFIDFKRYIESKFETWMNWENHGVYTGNYNETWQLDHIIPISYANCKEDIIYLNFYKNLIPLCSKKNNEKSNKMKNIHLLWCTIRPLIFIEMHKIWILRSNKSKSIYTHIAVNTNDDAKIIEEYLKNINNSNYRIIIVDTTNIGVCYPSYKLSSTTEGKDNDIIVFASDDFIPPMDWVNYLFNKLDGLDTGLIVRDGYQLPDSSNMLHPAITIPIMTWGCFEKLNKIIYHPSFVHMFSDCELYNNLKDSNMLYDDRLNDETTFEHLHYAAGKRSPDIADQTYVSKWKEDEVTWNNRKLMSLEERLKV